MNATERLVRALAQLPPYDQFREAHDENDES